MIHFPIQILVVRQMPCFYLFILVAILAAAVGLEAVVAGLVTSFWQSRSTTRNLRSTETHVVLDRFSLVCSDCLMGGGFAELIWYGGDLVGLVPRVCVGFWLSVLFCKGFAPIA
mmetsp:Transcript_27023/g.59826  ORF Transcript_27023/g.59826 Transcript_27023/m.59826 type:complete len:114 (+) Transcript_27023:511-852(+)